MGAVPRSLLVAVRDLAALAAVAFPGATALVIAAARRERIEFAAQSAGRITPEDLPFGWDLVGPSAARWTASLLLWLAVCWCATRARAGRRAAWLPAAVAAVVLAARTALPLLRCTGFAWWYEVWPGPSMPYRWDADGGGSLLWWHPAWGFPVLALALLAAAAALGARAGRRPDDLASHRVTPAPRPGVALAAVVVGLPALGGTAGALAAGFAASGGGAPALASPWGQVGQDVGLPLATALLACALLSGTGPIGTALAVVVATLTARGPLLDWMAGRSGDLLLGCAAGMALACGAVALWRPCAAWGGDILAPVRASPSPAATATATTAPGPVA